MSSETKQILDALLESRKILEAKLEAMDTKIEAMDTKIEAMDTKIEAMDIKLHGVATDVTAIKEHFADMDAVDRYLTHKIGELEAELFVVKRRQKA